MAKVYVFSTLANDQNYTNWVKGGGDVPIKGHAVMIKGGTGVANNRLITPLGVATEVTEFDLEELKNNPCFLEHQRDGYIVVKNKKSDTEKVASDMNLKDESAPMTDADYASEDEAPKYAVM
jgi:hypothetical protein